MRQRIFYLFVEAKGLKSRRKKKREKERKFER